MTKFATISGAIYEVTEDTVTRIAEHPVLDYKTGGASPEMFNSEPHDGHTPIEIGRRVIVYTKDVLTTTKVSRIIEP